MKYTENTEHGGASAGILPCRRSTPRFGASGATRAGAFEARLRAEPVGGGAAPIGSPERGQRRRQRRTAVRYGASTNGREREETERTTRTRSSPATRRAAQKRRGWLGGDGTDDERRRPWLEGNLDSGQLRAYRHDSFSEDGADDETELPAQFDLLGEAQDGGISRRPPARVRLVCGEEENEARRRNGRHRRGGGLRPRPYACQGTGAAGRGRGARRGSTDAALGRDSGGSLTTTRRICKEPPGDFLSITKRPFSLI